MSLRRRLLLLFAISLLLGLGCLRLLWQWKAPGFVERRLERITGHQASVASVTLTHRLELVAYDVRIAGAPPFASQTLARADRVVVRLGGPGGWWTPAEISIDGLDLEYLGTTVGDNVRGLAHPEKGAPATVAHAAATTRPPLLHARNARLRGSVALPFGPRVAVRVPSFDFERGTDGVVTASIESAVVDAEGLGSLHALGVSAHYDREGLELASQGNVALEVAGGGILLEGLALTANLHGSQISFDLRVADVAHRQDGLSGHSNPRAVEAVIDAQDVPLHALGGLAARRGLGLERAKASLHAALSVDRPSLRAEFSLDAKVGGVDLLHPSIDAAPWREQSASLKLHGDADLAAARIHLADGTLKLLGATFTLDGWVVASRSPSGSLVLATPRHAPLPCAALLQGQPEPVKQALAGFEVDGKLGFSLAMDFDATSWEDMRLDATVDPVCRVKSEANVLANLLPILKQPSLPFHLASKLPLGSYHPDFVSLSAMPKHLLGAFLTSEDGKFFRHHGFDLEMIRHALAQDLENHSFQRGASTITQQLAKNLFLSQRRTLARKVEEAVLTWRLQELLSKERVLELYLNVIELGPGIRGVKQAAREYFGKDVTALTPLESAHLAALTPNPHVLARRFRDGKVDEGWQQRLLDLLGMMRRHGRLSAADLAAARASKLVLRELGTH